MFSPKLIWILLSLMYSEISYGQSSKFTIIPESEYFYLENWNLKGEIRTITIRTYSPRDGTSRFLTFDDCRMLSNSIEKFSVKEETFLFNRKGRLMKRTSQSPSGKQSTLFSYNFFEKISAIETLDRIMTFQYDLEGKFMGTQAFDGARMSMISEKSYLGDSIVTISKMIETNSIDSIVEIIDSMGRIKYNAIKLPTHGLKQSYFEYDSLGRLLRNWNNLNGYFEYEYDDKNRIINTYMRPDKSFLCNTEYDDPSGIRKMINCELIDGKYLERNYECLCTAIDGHNNPVKQEYIDCNKSNDGDNFGLKNFVEITYDYFK